MKKTIILFVTLILGVQAFGQETEGILGKLGVSLGGDKPNPTYEFDGNLVQKVIMTDKKGKEVSMETRYYLGKNDAIIGSKITDSNDPDMKKSLGMIEFTILDIAKTKIFNFMNADGSKIVMGIGFKPDKLTETVEKENAKISVTKTGQTKTIMGYACDGYSVKNEQDKNDVVMWISQKPVAGMAKFAKNMRNASNFSKGGKQNNIMAYNAHPELVKIAKEGRAVLGFSSKGSNGESSEMEITKINLSEPYTFKTGEYRSMF